jgi:indolepyruvate decarboxylase
LSIDDWYLSNRWVIFLVNNNGYTIERLILGPRSSHNDINQWRYAEAAFFFDTQDQAIAYSVRTEHELEALWLQQATAKHSCRSNS